MNIEIIENPVRDRARIENLLTVWRESVTATHTFLKAEDIEQIEPHVPAAIQSVQHLVIAEAEGRQIGFAGADQGRLEMLFIHPDFRNQGIGKQIMKYLFSNCHVSEVCVNEQNPQARGFYEQMGFHVYKRTPEDEQGNPFPILYMKKG